VPDNIRRLSLPDLMRWWEQQPAPQPAPAAEEFTLPAAPK
jgi:hypothetical protein